MKADLHIHTNASFDATESPETLLKLARRAGIEVLAIADHNEIDGSLRTQQLGRKTEIEVLSGIEIDCFFQDNVIHLLGYGCDLRHPDFGRLRDHYVRELKRIGKLRLAKIEEHYSLKLNEAAIVKRAGGRPYTNVEITQELLENQAHPELEPYQQGSRSENPIANFYWDQLAFGKWGYTELKLPEYRQIIDFIHQQGGVLIVAHPEVNLGLSAEACEILRKAGADGFEVYSSYHDEEARAFYHAFCQRYDLIETFGSDFHGTTKPNLSLGQTGWNEDCTAAIEKLKQRIHFNTARKTG